MRVDKYESKQGRMVESSRFWLSSLGRRIIVLNSNGILENKRQEGIISALLPELQDHIW